jgi:fructokinase
MIDVKGDAMDLVCLGECLVDFFPEEVGRALEDVSAFNPKPGGAPANVAVAASRLGYSSAFIGKVGQDAFGNFLAGVLASEKVETRGLRFDPVVRTTLVFLSKPDANSYECLFYRNPGADTCLRSEELDESLLSETRAFQFGSLSLTNEPSRNATLVAIAIAHEAGALVCYDVNYRSTLWKNAEDARKMALDVIPLVDMVKVNEIELLMVGGNETMEKVARKLRALGPEICVVTLGERGSYIQTSLGDAFVPAFLVEAVDAAGCGDAFLAALLCKMTERSNWRSELNLNPKSLCNFLRYANSVGALTTTQMGTIPALPTAARVTEFLRSTDERNN